MQRAKDVQAYSYVRHQIRGIGDGDLSNLQMEAGVWFRCLKHREFIGHGVENQKECRAGGMGTHAEKGRSSELGRKSARKFSTTICKKGETRDVVQLASVQLEEVMSGNS